MTYNNSSYSKDMFDIHYKVLREGENIYEDISPDIQVVDAQYVESLNKYDSGNIFIESLPFPRTRDEVMYDFSESICDYNRSRIKKMTLSEKLTDIGMLREQLRIELPFHEELDNAVYQAFLKSYRNRKLCVNETMIKNNDNSDANKLSSSKLYKDSLNGQSYGSFNMIGLSGAGKSLAISTVLRHYRQVVVHHLKKGGQLIQILYINVQCPPNGNMDAFYSNIGKAIDVALGYTYPCFQNIIDKRRGLGQKLNEVINLIERFNIGLIILDEIQMFLSNKKSRGTKVNVKTESFQAITTIINSTGVSIAVIGTEIAYRMIFEDQIHQNRRLGQSIYADEYCNNKGTFMRIMRTLIQYQWTDALLTENDLTDEFLETFMECTHGIIDLIVGLYSAVQHEALINNRKSKINSAFVKRVAKKYYPNIIEALKSTDSGSYELIRKKERDEVRRIIESDIAKQKNEDQEKKITRDSAKPITRDKMIKKCYSAIDTVTKKYSKEQIKNAANEVYKRNEYTEDNIQLFIQDVYSYLENNKIPPRKKKPKLSNDIYAKLLNNEKQDY